MIKPQYFKLAANVLHSPYWATLRPNVNDPDYIAKNSLVRDHFQAFEEAVQKSHSYDELSPEMQRLFTAAEQALGR